MVAPNSPRLLANARIIPVIIPGIYYNAFEAYQSIIKIKALADIILPVHDPDLMNVDTIP